MGVRNESRWVLYCDRCGLDRTVYWNPFEDSSSELLYQTGWQFWGRVRFGTDQWLLCPGCVSALKTFFAGDVVAALVGV